MIEKPMDVLREFPVRKSKRQKQDFRDAASSYLKTIGYESFVEKGSFGAKNFVIGNPETAQFLVTAHYDTPARLPFPNLCTPCNCWLFWGYQILLTVLIFLVALIPEVVLLLSVEMDAAAASFIWPLSIYAILALMLVGPANKHNANDNTSGVVTVLEIARSMPESCRTKVCFVLFDLEEAGLIGSSSYRKSTKSRPKNS